MNNLNILNSQIIFSYSRNIEVRKRVFEFEEKLNNSFKTPFRTFAIPDEIDPNISRFESNSKQNHSRLQVSQVRTTLATNFDEDFSIKNASIYLKEKRSEIQPLIKKENINFFAYVLEMVTYIPENEINSILKKNTKATAIKDDCKDFSILYSKVCEKDFYLNIKCSKFAAQEVTLKNKKIESNVKHGISVTIDINSKYFFEKHNSFSNHLYETLEKILFDLIQKKSLKDYLQGNI